MRSWRNWQTRTVQVRVGDHGGSNPFDRTKQKDTRLSVLLFYRNVMDKGAYLESVLDEKVDVWYNEDNDETSERTQYEEDPVYLPRQYPKKPRNSLLYQCFSSLERRLLHHNYTICERALM